MAEISELVPKHLDYVRKEMAFEDRVLVFIRNELYRGSWSRMEIDLEDRTKSRPYIFKIANRIENDLKRMGKIKAYELEHEIDLTDYVEVVEKEANAKKSPY